MSACSSFTYEDSNGYIATDSYEPIPTEETADWNPLQFSSLIVQSQTQTNDYGHLRRLSVLSLQSAGHRPLPGNLYAARPGSHQR